MRRTYSMEDFAINPIRSDRTPNYKSAARDQWGSNYFALNSDVCFYNNPVAEKMSKVTFERDKLARQNKILTEMMDKCEEEIQKHLSAYEDLECSIQMMQPKALTLQSIDDLLLWYVQSNSEQITSDSLKNLKQKFK